MPAVRNIDPPDKSFGERLGDAVKTAFNWGTTEKDRKKGYRYPPPTRLYAKYLSQRTRGPGRH